MWRVCVLLLSVTVFRQATAYTLQDCPRRVPRDQHVRIHGNSCFYFQLSSREDFTTAEQACVHLGGSLATVRDSETQKFLHKVLQDDYHSTYSLWIGLRNSGNNGTFVWPNGREATYFNWGPHALSNVIPDNACVAMDTNNGGQWRLFPCHIPLFYDVILPFVCQFPISSECQQCGDVDNDVACTQLDLTFAAYTRCDAERPYCMNDVIQSSGSQRVFKRCVSETDCLQQWWQNTSNTAGCMALYNNDNTNDNGHSGEGDFQCHFCCVGNDCNSHVVPDRDTLYRPTGTITSVTTAPTTPSSTYSISNTPSTTARTASSTVQSSSTEAAVTTNPASTETTPNSPPTTTTTTATTTANAPSSETTSKTPTTTTTAATTATNVPSSKTTSNTLTATTTSATTAETSTTTASSTTTTTSTMTPTHAITTSPTKTATTTTAPKMGTNVTTTSATTPQTTTSKGLRGSRCHTCGSDQPCSHLQILMPHVTTCDDSTPFCMNDIIQTDVGGVITLNRYKRCVNETLCNLLWYQWSSDINRCINFSPDYFDTDLECHLCCYGDECNARDLPPRNTLYIPGRF